MSKLVTSEELFSVLNEHLNLDDKSVAGMEIICNPGDLAEVNVKFHVDNNLQNILEEEFSKYHLVDSDDI